MLAQITQAVDEHAVELLLVAGDIYDRALPPEWAVAALEGFLSDMAQRGVQVVMTAGNHDSAQRLGFGRALMTSAGIHFRTALEDSWAPVVFTSTSSGDAHEQLLVYGIPYIEPQLYAQTLGLERANHTAVMAEVLARIAADAQRRRQELPSDASQKVIVMAHVFAAHGVASASERHIGASVDAGDEALHHQDTLGGLSVVPLELFSEVDYAALGHLHGRQQLTQSVRYSGSPLRYSFSEADQAKGAWLGDSGKPGEITGLDWQVGRPLARLTGTIDEVLDAETVERHRDSYVQVKLTDPVRPERAFQRVQDAYPYLAHFTHSGTGSGAQPRTYAQRVEPARSAEDVVAAFLNHVRGRGPSGHETHLVAEGLEAIRLGSGPHTNGTHARTPAHTAGEQATTQETTTAETATGQMSTAQMSTQETTT